MVATVTAQSWGLFAFAIALLLVGVALWLLRGAYAGAWMRTWDATLPGRWRRPKRSQHQRWAAQGAVFLIVMGLLSLAGAVYELVTGRV